MKKRRTLLTVMVTLLLAGCQGNGSEGITITIWEDESNHELVTSLLDLYTSTYVQKYPLASVPTFNILAEEEGKSISAMTLPAPQGQGPDIFSFVHDTLSSGVVDNLISEVLDSEDIALSHQTDAVAAFTLDGKLYGYPITAESQTLMYDKRKLSADDVLSFENLALSGEKIVLDTENNSSTGYYMFSYLTDANLFGVDGTDPTQLNLNGSEGASNLKHIVNDYRGTITPSTPDAALAIMRVNEAAGVITSPYLWNGFKNEIGEENAGIAVLPSVNGNKARPFSGFKGYGVSRYSKHPHIAHDIAKFLSGEIAQRARFLQKGLLPTYLNANLEAEVNKSAVAKVFQTSLEDSLLMPNITAMGRYWAPANDAMTSIWGLGTSATTENISAILISATTAIKG